MPPPSIINKLFPHHPHLTFTSSSPRVATSITLDLSNAPHLTSSPINPPFIIITINHSLKSKSNPSSLLLSSQKCFLLPSNFMNLHEPHGGDIIPPPPPIFIIIPLLPIQIQPRQANQIPESRIKNNNK